MRALAIGLFVLIVACSAAKANAPPPTSMEEVAVFGSQLNLCVQTARTREDADACRQNVEKFWCGPGGALASSSGCEGWQDAGAGK